ncbi:MAG TPA: bacteriohopanetetrol glucosamine biosynthesis glycosyltransferase HpnI [Verrucomicrobiae bacterium]|nr:bacteriohopanetetrol glucosamine biosynthesis glycosyltransferase HpnI [Verrucomicrobiae bacterium]
MTLHMPIWHLTILLVALVPLGYYVVAILAVLRFFRRERRRPRPDFCPPVSILKPVHGLDFGSYENFASFCRQNYADYEILYCVNEMSDPAVPVIQKIMAEFPEQRIRIFAGAEQIGTNRKVNNLALLTKEARHEFLVQSDADVRVDPDYLREMLAPFADPVVGVVSCFYRGITQPNLFAEMEAIGAVSDFAPSAMVADWVEGVTFALGASVATRKTWLQKIGGYESFANYLADDYEIGYRVHKVGGKALLSREVVWTMFPALSLREFWEHQVRWARTTRLARPASFMGLIVTHGLPFAIAAALVAPAGWMAAAYLGAYLVLRLTLAWVAGIWGIGDQVLRRKWWLVPIRDAVHFIVWLSSFASNRVKWGDTEYTIEHGQMREVTS